MNEQAEKRGGGSVGELLSRERKSRKALIEEVATATKIQPKYIRALEENNFDVLPPEPFIKGFIEAYARCLGLDSQKVLSLYKEQVSKEGINKSHVNPLKNNPLVQVEKPLGSRRRASLSFLLFGLLCSLLVVWIGYRIYLQEDLLFWEKTSQKSEPLSPQISGPLSLPKPQQNGGASPASPRVETPTSPPMAPGQEGTETGETSAVERKVALQESKHEEGGQPVPPPAELEVTSEPLNLTVIADSETWLRVEIDEGEKREMLLAAGKTRSWKAQEEFLLSIGNVAGTRVQLNGKNLALPPATGNVLRNFRITRNLIR